MFFFQATPESTGIKFPDFKQPGVFVRSQKVGSQWIYIFQFINQVLEWKKKNVELKFCETGIFQKKKYFSEKNVSTCIIYM